MIEEIKKEIEEQSYNENFCTKIIQLDDLYKILDKYKDKEIKFEDGSSKFAIVKVPKLNVDNIKNYNQPDYKSAWNELKQSCYCKNATYEEEITYDEAFGDILEELETKYNIGGK